jgi:hypothetical protein
MLRELEPLDQVSNRLDELVIPRVALPLMKSRNHFVAELIARVLRTFLFVDYDARYVPFRRIKPNLDRVEPLLGRFEMRR